MLRGRANYYFVFPLLVVAAAGRICFCKLFSSPMAENGSDLHILRQKCNISFSKSNQCSCFTALHAGKHVILKESSVRFSPLKFWVFFFFIHRRPYQTKCPSPVISQCIGFRHVSAESSIYCDKSLHHCSDSCHTPEKLNPAEPDTIQF